MSTLTKSSTLKSPFEYVFSKFVSLKRFSDENYRVYERKHSELT